MGSARVAAHAHQYPQAEEQGHQRRASIRYQRQGYADHRQDAADHAHVDEGVGEEAQRDRAGEQPRERGRRIGGDHQAAEDQEGEAEQQRGAERGEDRQGQSPRR